MNTIIKTEAIVLRAVRFSESSKIITFYTRELGKISCIAKGVLSRKYGFCAALEVMSYVSIILYKKDGRNIQILTQCDIVESFKYLYENLEKMSVGMIIIDLVNNSVHEGEKNVRLFQILVSLLKLLNKATKNTKNVLYTFEIQICAILGFKPSFSNCVVCKKSIVLKGNKVQTIEYHYDMGGPICSQCTTISGHKVLLSAYVFQILKYLSEVRDFNNILDLEIDEQSKKEIEEFISEYFRYHRINIRSLRSKKVFDELFNDV